MVEHPTKGAFDASRAHWQSATNPDGSPGRIQVAFVNDLIGVRDGHDPNGPVLVYTRDEWDAFLAGAKDNEFDLTVLEADRQRGYVEYPEA